MFGTQRVPGVYWIPVESFIFKSDKSLNLLLYCDRFTGVMISKNKSSIKYVY